MPPGVRRVIRSEAPSYFRPGAAELCWICVRSCSHWASTVDRRSATSPLRWAPSRARTRPSTPCQAIVAMMAMMNIATSTSISVKPRAVCIVRG